MFRQKFLYQLPQVLGIRKISVNGIRAQKNPHSKEKFSGFSWNCAGPKSKFQNTFYQEHLWTVASGSRMFKVRNKNGRLMRSIDMDIVKTTSMGIFSSLMNILFSSALGVMFCF